LASGCLADDDTIKWRAEPTLDITRSSTNCGNQYKEPINIEFDGKTLKTSAWSRLTYDIKLLEPLNADGSGEVSAVSMPLNRSTVIRFEPGHGMAARCVYTFVPLENR
jgi:hypothetical protein